MNRFGILLILCSALACNHKPVSSIEKERIAIAELQKQNEALQASIDHVDTMLDSIYRTMNCVAKVSVDQHGTSVDKLGEINAFIMQTTSQLQYQETQIRKIKNEAHAYLMMMDALKSEAEIRESHLQNLTDSLSEFKVVAENNVSSL